ncbi:MAG: hypothetical protein ACTHON_16660, partial [Humibacter sp.]
VASTVTSVVQSVSVTKTVAPVAGAVDQIVGSVPVVGGALGSTVGPVSAVTAPVAGAVDSVLGSTAQATGTVLGPPPVTSQPVPPSTPSGGVTPAAPGESGDVSIAAILSPTTPDTNAAPLVVTDLRSSWQASASPSFGGSAPGVAGMPATPNAPPSPGSPGQGTPATSGSGPGSGAGSGPGGAGSVASLPTNLGVAAPSVALVGATADDDLPTIPAYETDSTPD